MASAAPPPPGGAADGAARPAPPGDLRVPVLGGRGRDVDLLAGALAGVGVRVEGGDGGGALAGPDVAFLVVSERAGRAATARAAAALAGQPGWSDLPVLFLVDARRRAGAALRAAEALGDRANVTVLDRPVRRPALEAVARLAVGARRKQLEVRDLLGRLTALNDGLQGRVEAQTARLRERADQVEALAVELTRAERRERERIAQLLHDDLQQLLYGLKLHVDRFASGAAPPDPAALAKVAGYVDESIEQTRLLTTDLHPPVLADDGLGAALGWVAEFARRRHGMAVHLDVIDEATVPDADRLALLTRAAKELLFNVVKHAGVREAWVSAWCDAEGCHVEVRDEGGGFAEGAAGGAAEGAGRGGTGRGLADIRDRVRLLGGRVDVAPGAGGGSRVTVAVPVDELPRPARGDALGRGGPAARAPA